MEIISGANIRRGDYENLFLLAQKSLDVSRSFLLGLEDGANSLRSVVAMEGDKIVGGAIGQLSYDYSSNNRICLSAIAVREEYWGRGIGGDILKRFESRCRDMAASGVELDTDIPLWFLARGYNVYYSHGEHSHMSKSFL